MAMKIETRELQPILAETQSAEGYALGLNGILKGYANEMKISYLNTTGGATVKIDSGILLWQGKRIYADNEGISFEIPNELTANTKYDIYLKIDMGQPDNVAVVYSKTGTYPSGYVTDDLFNNFRNGVNYVLLGNFINTATGIIQATQTVGYANNLNKLLWSGYSLLGGGQAVTFSELVSQQKNGIILAFSRYTSPNPQNYNWTTYFIPRGMIDNGHGGNGHLILGGDNISNINSSLLENLWTKYIYVSDDKLSGNAANIVGKANNVVLRYVFGF